MSLPDSYSKFKADVTPAISRIGKSTIQYFSEFRRK